MISKEEKQALIDLFPFIGGNPIVVDIGGNKGHWADIILEEYGGDCKLHIVEPNDKLKSFLEIKYEYNNNITYYSLPFYRISTVLNFHYFENYNNELSSIYDGGKDWDDLPKKSKSVQTTTLDEYCSMREVPKIDMLKIDCEGSDLDVLIGAKSMLSSGSINLIQIEYSEHWKRGEHKFSDLLSLCQKYGYTIYKYEVGNFWEVKEFSETTNYDNYYITKFDIHNYSADGWNNEFVLNTSDLPKMNLVAELGAFEGITTKYICENLLDETGRVVVVDPLNDFYVENDKRDHPQFRNQYQRFLRNTRGLPVELYRGRTETELPRLNALRFDLIFVDGNHYPPWPYFDLCWAFAITKIGGYIIADDYDIWDAETKGSIDKFLTEYENSYGIFRKGYQIMIQKTRNQYNDLTKSYYL